MLLNIHPVNPDIRKINQVCQCLEQGGLIIYPTDTVYSIACDILNSKALINLARLKKVKPEKANFSIICKDFSQIAAYTAQINNHVFKVMRQFLPGPYTFILPAGRAIPAIFSERKKTIGIRVPDNPIALAIVENFRRPIASVSLHDSDEILEYSTDPELIHERMEKLVAMVIDGGPGGLEPSTILDCTGEEITVIREGKGSIHL
jgi:tRNA threonylcarbamoyl adenosine modification protein (Sua5/YciO/YrdC/YwlC family)